MRARPRALTTTIAVAAAVASVSLEATAAQALEAPAAFTSVALPTWQTNSIAWATATSGGLVFAGGSFTSVRPPGAALGTGELVRHGLAVLDAATGMPTDCAPSFDLPSGPSLASVRSLSVSPDGATLYVGGFFSSVNGTAHRNLAAIDLATCTVVPSFNPSPNATVRALAATADTVYVGGDLTGMGGATRSYLGAVSSVTSPAPGALLPWAPTADGVVNALALKPDGSRVVAGGAFNNVNGVASHALVVLDPAGGIVQAAAAGFIDPNSVVKAITVDSTGFYVGDEGTGGGVFDGRFAMSWSDLTQRWRDTCLGATQALAVYQDVLYSGSHAHDCSSMGWWPDGPRHHFLAETAAGAQITSWFPDTNGGLGEQVGPRAMVVAATANGAYLWSAGEFTTVNGIGQQGLVRFGQGVDAAAPTAPTVFVTSFRPGQARVAWRPSLDTDDATLTYKVFRDGQLIATTTSSNPFWSRQELDVDDVGLVPGSSHSYKVSASDGTTTVTSAATSATITATGSAYAERVIADGASQLWRYDEPGNVFITDASRHRASGVLQGVAAFRVSPSAVPSEPSKALSLTGSSSILYSAGRVPAPTAYTEETWFRTTDTDGGLLMGFGSTQTVNSGDVDRQVFMTNSGRLAFGVHGNPYLPSVVTSFRSYNDGTWHLATATQDSGGMRLYVDGSMVGFGLTTRSSATAGYWRVGGDDTSTWLFSKPSTDYLTATVDETAIYPTALSSATVSAHYALGKR